MSICYEAETPILSRRIEDPGRFFLWHGGFSVDASVPASPAYGSWDLWGSMAPHYSWSADSDVIYPLQQDSPEIPRLSQNRSGESAPAEPPGTPGQTDQSDPRDHMDKGDSIANPRFEATARLGNEVGDQHLQELRDLGQQSNHTPLTQGWAHWYFPTSGSSSGGLWVAMDQNDHFSSTTLPLRSGIGDEEPTWFGENIPYYSFLQGGMDYQWENDWQTLYVNQTYQDGWLWTTSPWTGNRLPWRGRHFKGSVKLGSSWEGRGTFIHRKSLLKEFEEDKAWEERSGYLAWNKAFRWKSHYWHIKLQGGLSRVILDLDSLLYNGEGTTYPLNGEFRWHWGRAEQTRLQVYLRQHTKNGSFWNEGRLLGTLPQGAVTLTAELKGYAGDNEAILPLDREFLPGASQPITYPTEEKQFGISPKLMGLLERGPWSTELSAGVSARNGLLTFAADSLILRRGFPHRAGRVVPLEKNVWRTEGSWRQSLRGNRSTGGVQLAWQKPLTGSYKQLDYEPSAYVLTLFGKIRLPSDLTLETIVHHVGRKKVRHWQAGDRVFLVPEHWEGNLNLTQSLWDNRLQLSYTALHLFGREVLEHPLGNPLRFRIIVTATAAF